ncbi:hypothetical protein F5Y05DRAFT_163216 [Hypoxylon sp. FL0543]|nr:hypothetical protein F5Y05DRAFT_163216 [Hypoxylon sp. FL0543]
MEAKGYTRIDRGKVLSTLESRLAASQSPLRGPQVQLFRISSPPNGAPGFKMPLRPPSEEPHHEEISKDASTVTPPEDLIQTYKKRIQVMQAIINQLREAGQERKKSDDDAKKTREELARAKLRIAALEDELERGADEQGRMVGQHDAAVFNEVGHRKMTGENDEECVKLEGANESPAKRHADQDGRRHISNDVVILHHVIWGSQSVHDESLDDRLLNCATRGSSFTATCEFVGRGLEPSEKRTLVVAYSRAPDGPMRWLVIDEGQEGKFNLE